MVERRATALLVAVTCAAGCFGSSSSRQDSWAVDASFTDDTSSPSVGSPAYLDGSADRTAEGSVDATLDEAAPDTSSSDVALANEEADAPVDVNTATADAPAETPPTDAAADAISVDAAQDADASDPCSTGGEKIYVADFGNSRIVRSDDLCGANWTTFSGSSNDAGISPLAGAQGVAVDASGKIYVADTFNNRIVRMDDMTGTHWVAFGTMGTGTGQFSAPRSVFVDGAGHIFVTDGGNARVVRVDDMTGTNWTAYGTAGTGAGQFTIPWGLFVDGAGRIYVTDTDRSAAHAAARLVRFDDLTGTNWTVFGSPGSGTDQLQGPWGIYVDGSNRIYIADNNNSRVVRIDDMTGTNWTAYGTLGQYTGQFLGPTGVALDGLGRIYILDQGSTGLANDNRVVRVDDMTGTNWTTLGTLGAGYKQFDEASGLFLH
jgi:streptogramin lyase